MQSKSLVEIGTFNANHGAVGWGYGYMTDQQGHSRNSTVHARAETLDKWLVKEKWWLMR